MPKDIIVIPSIAVKNLRRKANRLKKESGITHYHALDLVARQTNFFHLWHHFIQAAKLNETTEESFRHGLVFAMDFKDLQDYRDENPDFVRDERMHYFVDNEYRKSVKNWTEDDDDNLEDLSLLEYFRCTQPVPATLDDALSLIYKDFFFPPQLVWIRGKRYDPLAENGGVIARENLVVWGE